MIRWNQYNILNAGLFHHAYLTTEVAERRHRGHGANFSFKIDSLNKGQSISFSSVGYESDLVKVDERSSTGDLMVKWKEKYIKTG